MAKMRLVFLAGLFSTISVFAQDTAKQEPVDTTYVDYEELFNELDALLDSLTAPRDFIMINMGVANGFFNYRSKFSYSLETSRKTSYAPSLSYFSRMGLGVSATGLLVNDGVNINPYQFYLTGSYDYMKNNRYITGIALTRFFTKDSLSFYTSPLQNEIYAYFTYKKFWVKPSLAVSYGWGSRSEYEKREEYITYLLLRLNGYTHINTTESVHDFNVITSLRHDFYWMEVLGKKDYIRFTPQIVFTSGTQKFGFNQSSSTYATIPRNGANVLFTTEDFYLDNKLYFQPLSLATYIKTEYSRGKFFFQPQVIFDYYFPAPDKNFTTAFVMNAGVIF